MNDDFRISICGELMAASLKFGTQLLKVINFSVENHAHGAVFAKDRLMSACNINDAEAPDAQSDAVFRENSFVVRAAMRDALAHAVNRLGMNLVRSRCAHDAGDSAHRNIFSRRPAFHTESPDTNSCACQPSRNRTAARTAWFSARRRW